MFFTHHFRYDLFDLKVTDVKVFFEIEDLFSDRFCMLPSFNGQKKKKKIGQIDEFVLRKLHFLAFSAKSKQN